MKIELLPATARTAGIAVEEFGMDRIMGNYPGPLYVEGIDQEDLDDAMESLTANRITVRVVAR